MLSSHYLKYSPHLMIVLVICSNSLLSKLTLDVGTKIYTQPDWIVPFSGQIEARLWNCSVTVTSSGQKLQKLLQQCNEVGARQANPSDC